MTHGEVGEGERGRGRSEKRSGRANVVGLGLEVPRFVTLPDLQEDPVFLNFRSGFRGWHI